MIPEDWEVKLLPEVLQFLSGKAHEQHIVPHGKYIAVNSKFISSDGNVAKFSDKNFCPAKRDDILMVMSDLPNGKALAKTFRVFENDRYAVNQRVCILRSKGGDAGYFQYILNRNPYFMSFDDGVQQTHLLNATFANCPLPVPPTVVEQAAIAKALSDMDEAIAAQAAVITKKRALKVATMQALLSGTRRLPGFSGEWEIKRLGDIAKLYQPTTIAGHQLTDSGFPVYGANGVVGFYDRFNHDTWQCLVTCRGSTCGTVKRTFEKCWITGNAMVLNVDHNPQIEKHFFFHLLTNQDFAICITGSGQPQIVRSPLANFEVSIPPSLAEQRALADLLSDLDCDVEISGSKLAKLRLLKTGMMQQLLTGKIRLV